MEGTGLVIDWQTGGKIRFINEWMDKFSLQLAETGRLSHLTRPTEGAER